MKTDDIVFERAGIAFLHHFSLLVLIFVPFSSLSLAPRLTNDDCLCPCPRLRARNTSWRSFRTRSFCCSPPQRSLSCSPVMTSTSQMRKPFFKPWWCGCATTSRIDSRTSGCFWPLSDYRFFLHRWGSRQGGIEITPASLPESKAVMNLLCPLFIKILFFAVNKPREQIHNAFFSHTYLNIYAGFVLLCM